MKLYRGESYSKLDDKLREFLSGMGGVDGKLFIHDKDEFCVVVKREKRTFFEHNKINSNSNSKKCMNENNKTNEIKKKKVTIVLNSFNQKGICVINNNQFSNFLHAEVIINYVTRPQ